MRWSDESNLLPDNDLSSLGAVGADSVDILTSALL